MLVSAFAVHNGGGAVLLSELVDALAARSPRLKVIVDARFEGSISAEVVAKRVPRRLLARLHALWDLGRTPQDEVLICFNGLPPLRRANARTIAYVHATYLVRAMDESAVPIRTRARHAFERLLFRLGRGNLDEIWVQTELMADAVRREVRDVDVRVLPFAPSVPQLPRSPGASFVYPADAGSHKNHRTLLEAWDVLHREGLDPPLVLTIAETEIDRILAKTRLPRLAHVLAVGNLERQDLLVLLAGARALIYPSRSESFGLPLVEAARLGVPILASDLPFVSAACRPTATFDPCAPDEIALAVHDFIKSGGQPAPAIQFPSAADFASELAAQQEVLFA